WRQLSASPSTKTMNSPNTVSAIASCAILSWPGVHPLAKPMRLAGTASEYSIPEQPRDQDHPAERPRVGDLRPALEVPVPGHRHEDIGGGQQDQRRHGASARGPARRASGKARPVAVWVGTGAGTWPCLARYRPITSAPPDPRRPAMTVRYTVSKAFLPLAGA